VQMVCREVARSDKVVKVTGEPGVTALGLSCQRDDGPEGRCEMST